MVSSLLRPLKVEIYSIRGKIITPESPQNVEHKSIMSIFYMDNVVPLSCVPFSLKIAIN